MDRNLIRELETRNSDGSSAEKESSVQKWLLQKPKKRLRRLNLTSVRPTSGTQGAATRRPSTRSTPPPESRGQPSDAMQQPFEITPEIRDRALRILDEHRGLVGGSQAIDMARREVELEEREARHRIDQAFARVAAREARQRIDTTIFDEWSRYTAADWTAFHTANTGDATNAPDHRRTIRWDLETDTIVRVDDESDS